MKITYGFSLLALLLPAFASAPARGEAEKPQYRICYFSLNNGEELGTVRRFMDKINQSAPFEVLVEEHQEAGDDPNQSFKKMLDAMVAQGKQCNGIIFSGHHTGNFGGARAKRGTRLKLNYLEDLSCDPKYREFFRGVSAYWGEGCRTMGAEVAPEDPNELDANWQANRVNGDAEGDRLFQGMAALENEFTNTLDQDNPLSSRYMRLFPNAKLFGWTKRSPGGQAGSKFSLTYHIAHMARLLDEQDSFPSQGPNSREDFTAENSARYADAVLALLSNLSEETGKSCELLATQAWHNHGDVSVSQKYTYDNLFANGFVPLAKSQDSALLTNAKDLDCQLKAAARASDSAKLEAVLDHFADHPDALRFSFNSLVDLRNELRKKASKEAASKDPAQQGRAARDQAKAALVLEKMKQNPKIRELLKAKLEARTVGVLRKVEYYEFYRQLTGNRLPELERSVQEKSVKELTKPLPANPGDHYARFEQVDYRGTLLQSLLKNRMVSGDFFGELLKQQPDREVLVLLRQNLRFAAAGERQELEDELDARIASTEPWVDSADPGPRPAAVPGARALAPNAPEPAQPQPAESNFFLPDLLRGFLH